MTSDINELAQLADAYVDAYNSADFDALSALLADDVHIIHHNRGVEVHGRDAALELFKGYGAAFPDRAFRDRTYSTIVDHQVLVQHTWGGTAAADVPGWASAGEKVALELTTFLHFKDGKLVEYHDYG